MNSVAAIKQQMSLLDEHREERVDELLRHYSGNSSDQLYAVIASDPILEAIEVEQMRLQFNL